jgi:predicted ATPase
MHRSVATLLDHSARHRLPLWHAAGRCYDGVLRIEQGDTIGGLHILRTELAELAKTRFELRYVTFLADLAEAYVRAGDIASARETIDQALERCHQIDEFWNVSELLRIKGEISRRDTRPDAAKAAESCFLQSLDWARRQEARSWELRAATSLARLWRSQGRSGEARDQVGSVYGRFTEGFETADLRAARELLNEIS